MSRAGDEFAKMFSEIVVEGGREFAGGGVENQRARTGGDRLRDGEAHPMVQRQVPDYS